MRHLLVHRALHPYVLFAFLGFGFFFGYAAIASSSRLVDAYRIVEQEGKYSVPTQNLITKKIVYTAPQSGEVYLSWYADNISKEDALQWNEDTKISENKLFTPMLKDDGQFVVNITMPFESQIFYGFFITKDSDGIYQNFWDWKHNNVLNFNDATPVKAKANYSEPIKDEKSKIIGKGWLVFGILFVVLSFLFVLAKTRFKQKKPISNTAKILILGLSVYVFHTIARSEIVSISPKHLLTNLQGVFKLFKASLNDLLYVVLFVVGFIILHFITKRKRKLNRMVYFTFVGLGLISVLVSFINIETVAYLGQPFNYEWLYYSDFLGSDDAKNALSENLSIIRIINLVAIMVSAWMLSKVLQYLYGIAQRSKHTKYGVPIAIVLVFCVLFVGSKKVNDVKDNGKTDNAILAMLSSFKTSDISNSFFTLNLPLVHQKFVPNQGEIVKKSLDTQQTKPIKNVLFVVLESSGAEYFDLYGGQYSLNSNLNQYANQALIFKNAYAHAPGTVKSLVSILGSTYPYISYKSLTYESPDFKHPTLSSVLKNQGYRTSFFSSASLNYLSTDTYLAFRGFDVVKDFKEIDCSNRFKQSIYDDGNGIDDMCLGNQFERWLEEAPTENFFSILWTLQGHYPYFFSGKEIDFGVNNLNFNKYLNIIKHNDDMIGAIMQTLKKRELDESTLVVVVGDHGESFGQHGQYGHGSHIYEENLRVPLLFINSQLFSGEQRNDLASMKDLGTTVLSILNKEIPTNWQGRNLIASQSDEAFFFAPWSDYLFGFRKGDIKYIFNESNGEVEIYNLATDPKEMHNIFNETSQEEIEQARIRIASWVQYHDDFVKEHFLKTK